MIHRHNVIHFSFFLRLYDDRKPTQHYSARQKIMCCCRIDNIKEWLFFFLALLITKNHINQDLDIPNRRFCSSRPKGMSNLPNDSCATKNGAKSPTNFVCEP